MCSLSASVMHCTPWEPLRDFYLNPGVTSLFTSLVLFRFDLTNYKVALQLNPWVTNRKVQSGAGLYISPHIQCEIVQHGE